LHPTHRETFRLRLRWLVLSLPATTLWYVFRLVKPFADLSALPRGGGDLPR